MTSGLMRARRPDFELVRMGLLLFIVGLLLGFVVVATPGMRTLVITHTSALASGTFLIAAGLAWRFYLDSCPAWLARGLWISHYLLTFAVALTAPGLAPGFIVGPLILATSVGMTGVTLLAFFKLAPGERRLHEQ